jgi:hypothetical protein
MAVDGDMSPARYLNRSKLYGTRTCAAYFHGRTRGRIIRKASEMSQVVQRFALVRVSALIM